MKKLLFLCLGAGSLCLGCKVTAYTDTVKVISQKGPASPLTQIFLIYVDEPCNFSLDDSTGYNICLRSIFEDSSKVKSRSRVEKLVGDNLATQGTAVYKSSDLMGLNSVGMHTDNSFGYFRRMVDSMHFDAILMLAVHRIARYEYRTPVHVDRYGGMTGGDKVVAEHVYFDCTLIDPKDHRQPIWNAKLENEASPKFEMNRDLARLLAKRLRNDGYIVIKQKTLVKTDPDIKNFK